MVHLHKSDMGILCVYFYYYYNLGSVISNNTLKNKISFLLP